MTNHCLIPAVGLLMLLITPGSVVFTDLKTAFNKGDSDRELVEQDAELTLDPAARTFVVKSKEHPLNIKFDDIERVVFDTSVRMRGGKLGRFIGGGIGASVSAHHVTEVWCYLEYREPDGSLKPYMLVMAQDRGPALTDKICELLGDKVVVTEYPQKATEIEKKTLKDVESKHDFAVDKKNHPMPVVMPDKAMVVVVCPRVPSEDTNQMKIHANDHVVLVNRSGTYGFFYLDPGDYQLASQAGNAVALNLKLEAGQEYYLLQEPFMGGMKSGTGLSQHSKELVMHLLDASNHGEWKRK